MIHDISKMTYIEAKAHVYSLMLFPESNMYTERAYFFVCYELAADEIAKNDKGNANSKAYDRIMSKFIGRLIRSRCGYDEYFSLFAKQADDLIKLIKKRQFVGMMVGMLTRYLFESKDNITASTKSFSEMMSSYKSLGGITPQDMSYSNLRHNIWPSFSPVAHLWAAAVEVSELRENNLAQQEGATADLLDCPRIETIKCPTGLAGFLCIAAVCLKEGARTRMSRRGPASSLFDIEAMHDFKLPWGLMFKPDNLK